MAINQCRFLWWATCLVILALALAETLSTASRDGVALAQDLFPSVISQPDEEPADAEGDPLRAPAQVEVQPTIRDAEIQQRLESILQVTGWFEDPEVRVDEGVAFLQGKTSTDGYRKWAGDLARNTRDVVAVVNKIEVQAPAAWDLRPALTGLGRLLRDFLHSLPFVAFGLLILLIAYALAHVVARLIRRATHDRISVSLLREVTSRAAGMLVFLFGLYLVLKVSGLTRLALTVLGGTGLFGLVIGIAFRDITENFLASILLSVQRPFETGDLIEIAGTLGYVQQLNVRSTVLMSLTGNHIQIPNSTVYKATIFNYTSNPNRREEFVVGIGYDATISEAQQIALEVLAAHPAVLNDPEPWVLADRLGATTVDLKVYFWIDGSEHSWLKVRSSVIRLIKREFQQRGISMPDEAREVVFPAGVPVYLQDERGEQALPPLPRPASAPPTAEADAPSVKAEGGLATDAGQIEQQARHSRNPEKGEDLLEAGKGERRP